GPEPVAGHIDDVINTAGDPVIAVGVAPAAVAGEVAAWIGGEVGLHEALVVAVDGAHLPRPRIGDAQVPFGGAVQLLALGVDNFRLDAEERPRRRAGLELRRARQWGDEDAAGFGLPPRVHDRAAALADDAVIPFPGFRIDRLAD